MEAVKFKAPVAYFAFNRPQLTRQSFAEIRNYRPSTLLLVADGPRLDVLTDKARCEAVRKIMKSVDWDCEVKTNFSEVNLGCKIRMSSGIDWVFSQVEEAIFLEDDCVPCQDFFRFCSEMLFRYRDNPKIMSIAGSNYQSGKRRGNGSYYFSRFPHIWGWASWRRAWKHYDVTMGSWQKLRVEKWIESACPHRENYFWDKLFGQVYDGKIDTWDCQWLYACWRAEGLGIIPNVNLITNIGAGPDATHTKGDIGSLALPTGMIGDLVHPKEISVNSAADSFTFETHFCNCDRNSNRKPFGKLYKVIKKTVQIVAGFLGFKITRLAQPTHENSSNHIATGILNFIPFKIESHSKSQLEDYASIPDSNQFLGRLAVCMNNLDDKLGIIDVGANCGDTAAIIRSHTNLPILCIEGDYELYTLLVKNMRQCPDVTLVNTYIGEVTGPVTVKIERKGWNNTLIPSKASDAWIQVVRLDDLSHAWFENRRIGLIKVDTEGFDVPILFGAKKLLQSSQPIIVFEYNRDNMDAISESGMRVFSYLASLDYESLMVYDNYGRYFITTTVQDIKLLNELDIFIRNAKRGIFYFDIVAFHKTETAVLQKLREVELARDRGND